MRWTAAIAALALPFGTSTAATQQLVDTTRDLELTAPARVAPLTAPAGAAAMALPPQPRVIAPEAEDRTGGAGSWKGLAHALGGGLVGGWVGFIGSQLSLSDWDKEYNGELRGERLTWTAAGVVAGVLGSRLLVPETKPPVDGPTPFADEPLQGRTITTAEIREAAVTTAYELIHSLHREWLVPRGTNSFSETALGRADSSGIRVRPGRPKVQVYLNDIHIGGPGAMHEIPADWLTGAEFLGAREATYRYGMGHTHGAIRLSTAVSPPDER